jgi:hypothetical protein
LSSTCQTLVDIVVVGPGRSNLGLGRRALDQQRVDLGLQVLDEFSVRVDSSSAETEGEPRLRTLPSSTPLRGTGGLKRSILGRGFHQD